MQFTDSSNEIGFDQSFEWFVGRGWVDRGEPLFRLPGEETIKDMQHEAEMEQVLKGIEKAFVGK